MKVGVIAGYFQAGIGAERISAAEAPVVQINTEGAYDLSAPRVCQVLKTLGVHDPNLTLNE